MKKESQSSQADALDSPPDADLDKTTIEALAAFRYLLRRFLHDSEERARQAKVTPQQYQLLLAVQGQPERDWATVNELAEALQIQHHAAVGLITRCERAKLLRRVPDENDKRQRRIVLTPKGLEITHQIARMNFAELKELLLSLELLFQQGVLTMPQATAIVNSIMVDRPAEERPRRQRDTGRLASVAA